MLFFHKQDYSILVPICYLIILTSRGVDKNLSNWSGLTKDGKHNSYQRLNILVFETFGNKWHLQRSIRISNLLKENR